MPTMLRLDSSLYSGEGVSSQLTERFSRQWVENHPGTRVIYRDLAANPPPHLDADYLDALATSPDQRSESQRQRIAVADLMIDELRQAQTVVIGLPLYNFGIPSTLKAWFDHIARAGETFYYEDTGPVGMLGGRKVFALSTRGDKTSESGSDPQTDHVRQMLNFLGMRDVRFVYAEGLTLDESTRNTGIAGALVEIARLTSLGAD
jgi:FMN-dependent NADH-azoreductase